MEHCFDLAIVTVGEFVIKRICVHIVRNLQIGQIAKFVALLEVVDGNDVGDAAGVEPGDDIAANESGCAGYNDTGHANNSS
jgi:hypothetical protein